MALYHQTLTLTCDLSTVAGHTVMLSLAMYLHQLPSYGKLLIFSKICRRQIICIQFVCWSLGTLAIVHVQVYCTELWLDGCSYSCRFSLIWLTLATMLHLHSFLFLEKKSGYDWQASSLHTVCAVQCALRRTLVGWLFLFMSIQFAHASMHDVLPH